jgi:hypothetical protein
LEELDKYNVSFGMNLTKENGTYHVVGLKNEFEGSFTSLPASVETPYGVVSFTKNQSLEGPQRRLTQLKEELQKEEDEKEGRSKDAPMIITITSPKQVASAYAKRMNIAPTSKLTSIAQITLRDQSAERGFDFLKHLAVCYNRQANADKNEIAYKTEEFINDRLKKISDELGSTESKLEVYKRNNNLVQIRLDATQTMTQANQYYGKLA